MDNNLHLNSNLSVKYQIATFYNQPYRVISQNIIDRYQKIGIKDPINHLNTSSESSWKMLFKVSHILWMNSLLRHADVADMPKFLQLFNSLEREFLAIQNRMEWIRMNTTSALSIEKRLFCSLKPHILQTSDLCAEWLYPRRWITQEILMKGERINDEKVCNIEDYNSFFYDNRIPLWWKNIIALQ